MIARILAGRGENLAAFDGATPDFHHGLPAPSMLVTRVMRGHIFGTYVLVMQP
jgi:hypothetical protein